VRTGNGNRRGLTVALAVAACAFGMAACGSSSNDDSSAAAPAASTNAAPAGAHSPGLAAAKKLVEENSKIATDFKAPGPPIKGAKAALGGKTVWYIPITYAPAFFVGEAKTIGDALSRVGAKVHVCDGKANPSSITSCMTQAANSGAAGVITDAIAVPLAEQGYKMLAAKKIPTVASQLNLPIPTDGAFAKYLARNEGNELGAQALGAANIIVQSNGKAKVLMFNATDLPSSKLASAAAIDEVKKNCPGCDVTIFDGVNTSPKVGTAFSAALLAHPNTEYIYSPYEAPTGELQLQGIKQTGRKVTVVMSAGDPAGLKRVAAGTQLSDSGTDPVAMGWNAVDTLLRLATGMPATNIKTNIRLFTKDNVPKDLSDKARDTGEWYSDMSYKPMYTKLWTGSDG
jgi:ribose transport system substrate-binding protein